MSVFKHLLRDYRDSLIDRDILNSEAARLAVIREYEALQARLEAAEKDAARWRMVRDNGNTLLDTKEHCIFERDGWEIHGLLQGDALDAEIDKAMQPKV